MPPSDTGATDSRVVRSPQRSSVSALPTFITYVAEVTDRSPNVREIVLDGGLDEFVSLGADQFVYLMVQRPGGTNVPTDHTMADQLGADPGTGPIGAYYTVRSWEPRTRRITLWMVCHRHHGGVGSWAERCEIGERVAVWGPRAGFGVRADAPAWLLVADESGLGAVAALLDELPSGASARVLAETVDAAHVIELPSRDGVTVTWLYRGHDDAGTSPRLLETVRSLDLANDVPRGLVVFGAGESAQMAHIRAHLRHQIRVPADNVSITGYWRHQPA